MLDWAERRDHVPILENEVNALAQGWIMAEDPKVLNTHLWKFIKMTAKGEAMKIVKSIGMGHGLEVWRALIWEINKGRAGRAAMLAERIRNPAAIKSYQAVSAAIAEMDSIIQDHEGADGRKFDESELKQFLLRALPQDLRESLILKATEPDSYMAFKQQVRMKVAFIMQCRQQSSRAVNSLEPPSGELADRVGLPTIFDERDNYDDDDDQEEDQNGLIGELHAMLSKFRQNRAPMRRPFRAPPGREQRGPPGARDQQAGARDQRCANCGKLGHSRAECRGPEVAPDRRPCFNCGKPGHRRAQCPDLKKSVNLLGASRDILSLGYEPAKKTFRPRPVGVTMGDYIKMAHRRYDPLVEDREGEIENNKETNIDHEETLVHNDSVFQGRSAHNLSRKIVASRSFANVVATVRGDRPDSCNIKNRNSQTTIKPNAAPVIRVGSSDYDNGGFPKLQGATTDDQQAQHAVSQQASSAGPCLTQQTTRPPLTMTTTEPPLQPTTTTTEPPPTLATSATASRNVRGRVQKKKMKAMSLVDAFNDSNATCLEGCDCKEPGSWEACEELPIVIESDGEGDDEDVTNNDNDNRRLSSVSLQPRQPTTRRHDTGAMASCNDGARCGLCTDCAYHEKEIAKTGTRNAGGTSTLGASAHTTTTDHSLGIHRADEGGILQRPALRHFGVQGDIAFPADEAVLAETPQKSTQQELAEAIEAYDGINVLEAERQPEDIMALLPKVTLLKIALDSGACEHVASREDLSGFKIEANEASRRGDCYIAANGDRVPNQGECRVGLRDKFTGNEFDSLFQLAPVSRPLYSVGRICDAGAEVSFTAKLATVTKNGKVLAVFNRSNGLYVASIEVKGEADPASSFIRQGAVN
jgi:hypothetical protein